jgi:hypothetical protein
MADIDQDVHALKEWLRAAWRQLGEPSLTSFARQELRTEMKRCSEDLRYRLHVVASQPPIRDEPTKPAPVRRPKILNLA